MTSRAVVLARGLGTRLREPDEHAVLAPEQRRAADAGAKPLMPIAGRPFLDYLLSALADAGLTRVALVVPAGHDAFRRRYDGEQRPSRLSVDFVVQREARGTADAVRAAEAWTAGEPFVMVNGDNLYPVNAVRRVAALDGPGLALFAAEDLVRTSNIPPERVRAFALVTLDECGRLVKLIEKPTEEELSAADPVRTGISMNLWRFDSRIFRFCAEVTPSRRGELELADAIRLAVQHGVSFQAVRVNGPVLDLSRRADAAELSRRLAGADVRL